MHYALVPQDVVESFDSKRVICTINNSIDFHCAFNFSKTKGNYIYINKSIVKELHLHPGKIISLVYKKDTTKYQFELPEEFEEVLKTDKHALQVFNSLKPGNQRGIIHLIAKIKSTDKRIEKSLSFAEKLKMGITKPRDIVKNSP